MKVHYVNILLFALPLNILVISLPKNPFITQKIPTTRLLCECKLYSPANYDNDKQMKSVIDNFNKQTQQRLHEYNERMKTTRQECKEQCDKEIQKIILKDKLEKELMDKFATLHTDIQSDAIPTCVCEKSIADKVEKGCLKCAQHLGGIAVPSSGVLGEIAAFAVEAWKTEAIAAATELAKQAGAAAGLKAGNTQGMKIVIHFLKQFHIDKLVPDICKTVSSKGDYTYVIKFADTIIEQRGSLCGLEYKLGEAMCKEINNSLGTIGGHVLDHEVVPKVLNGIVQGAEKTAKAVELSESTKVTAELTAQETILINTTYTTYYTSIIASIAAIVVIVLIIVIIYLILRYRRKKKMKKKLQYIKLLEE